jgi:putative YhdH/YhfP family quinone oxidoreductase
MDPYKNHDFLAYRVNKDDAGNFTRSVRQMNTGSLPEGDVLIRVMYSGLNYKDALSAFGNPGVTRNYPHTPGIDACGIVEWTSSGMFNIGDNVIVTSYDLGMDTDGGFGQFIRVPSDWVIKLPEAMTLRDSMVFGTAGLTAAQGVYNLVNAGQKPADGPLVVTGARGAVGSFALSLLAKLGFKVLAAVSTLGDDTERLKELGADDVIDSQVTDDKSGKALIRPLWAGAFDTVGGNTLATILKACSYGGNVISVGNIGSGKLDTTVYPFIIRGISLTGVATQDTPMPLRKELWNLLAGEWKPLNTDKFTREIGLNELDQYLTRMINKSSRGRILLNLWN